MKRGFYSLLAALLLLPFAYGTALAEGFGTPAIDGVVDGVYGSAEASDPSGDHWAGNNNIDLLDLYVCNDNTYWYICFTINDDIATTNWGKYRLYIDTTNDTTGGTNDPWGRNVVVSETHEPEFSVGSWVDDGTYGPEDTQLWTWAGAGSWTGPVPLSDADLSAGTTSGIEWKISRAALGDPDTIWVEVWSTGGGTPDNAQDTSNDPADDWNASDWTTQSILSNSTKVALASGGDTTPPTLDDAYMIESFRDTLIAVFSEPLDPTTAATAGNYTVTGVNVTAAELLAGDTQVKLTLDADLALGSCITLEAVNVEDVAGNPIVDNNTTNVHEFYLTELLVQAFMNIYLRTNSAATDPDTVGLEGAMAPITWDPTCDDLLFDPEEDSVFVGTFVFKNTCTNGVTDTTVLEYKFTHQCTTWEQGGNHVYTLDGTYPIDTLDIWWENTAPQDFTDKDIDVIFFVRSNTKYLWDRDVDTIGVNGSQSPFNWDVPPVNRLDDDGALPDSAADDGIFTTRITFPVGSRKNVDFKYLWKQLPDTLFNYECFGQGNRNVYLNDTLFSTTDPIVMDLAFWDICGDPTGVEEGDAVPAPKAFDLLHNVPNPFNPSTGIEFTLPGQAHVDLSIYDVSGRLVRRLLDAQLAAGSYTGDRAVLWNGTDDRGMEVPSGVYFYRLKADEKVMTKKMVLVR